MPRTDAMKRQMLTEYQETGERIPYPTIGRLVPGRHPGDIWVEHNGFEPRPARILTGLNRMELTRRENHGREVLLLFADGDPMQPIVIGMIENLLESMISLEIDADRSQDMLEAKLDGKRVKLEAEDEIVLKCGKGSIAVRKDGKIVIKGTHILSRASGPNRIKGGHVDIN